MTGRGWYRDGLVWRYDGDLELDHEPELRNVGLTRDIVSPGHGPGRTPLDLDVEEMVRLYVEEGMTRDEIGSRFGISNQTVSSRLREAGVEMRPRGLNRKGLKPCGTAAAYTRHRRAGETPCDACRRANADQKATERALRSVAA